ncbi:MAG: creatininase family protein [Thermoplasmata archaeon]|nr:creatininase family protein [Thermoplasmata archaeon]
MRSSHRLLEMDSRTLERRLRENPVVIVPVGALEAHGPHLPLGADQIQAESTAEALAGRIGALIAPTLPYGSCASTRPFPGTVNLSIGALSRLVRELLEELARSGVRRALVLSGHAAQGHMAALREGAEEAVRAVPALRVVVLSDYDFVYELRGKLSPATDGHGGLLETSRVLAMSPGTVGTERPRVEYRYSRFQVGDPTVAEWPESVIGDTGPATAELGQRVQAHVLDRLEATVRELLPAA